MVLLKRKTLKIDLSSVLAVLAVLALIVGIVLGAKSERIRRMCPWIAPKWEHVQQGTKLEMLDDEWQSESKESSNEL